MGAWANVFGVGVGGAVSVAVLLAVVLLVVVLVSHARGRRRARETAALAASLQQARDELQRVACHDALTGLPNRLHFEQRLRRSAAQPLAVLFVDLDDFAPVNETFGHAAGDEVLREMGRRLQVLAGDGVDAARIGGDAFVLRADGGRDVAAALARRVIAALQQPVAVEGREAHLTCSVGIALSPDDGHDARLIARAHTAMLAAKRLGGSVHAFYALGLGDGGAPERLGLLADLRHAIARGELRLLYQPKIDARSGQVTAAEALLRWDHPTRGLVPPAVFMPLAERYGLIDGLGQWVIDDACRQARAWRDAGLRMRVAVNLSAMQMRDEGLVDRLLEALRHHGVRPGQFTCEITETVAMSDTAAARRTFQRLGEAGVHVSIDDFGTGHSSLAYLRQLPVQELKIDRGFVADLAHSDDACAIVEAVLQMAHALGLKVVAEGVEEATQRDLLVQMGCDELQGYLFARPMPAEALTRWALGDGAAPSAHATLEFRASLFAPSVQAGL